VNSTRSIRQALVRPFELEITEDPAQAIALAGTSDFDLLLISLALKTGDGLRLCTQIKTIDRLRQTPVVLITDADQTALVTRALDLGVNDYITRPIDSNELRARVRTQLRRRLYQEALRSTVSSAVELAVTDPLTNLYNRRYLDAASEVGCGSCRNNAEAGLRADLRHRPLQRHQRYARARDR
jgi:two-component system cell cycle response regulator